MKKLGVTIKKLYRNELARWIFALICALALVALAASLSTLSFYDNDDLNIAWALAGYRTGTPSFAHPFINCIMAFIASALYTVFPRIPWWLVLQLAAIVLGMAAVFASLLKIGAKNKVPLILPLALMAVLGAGVFYYGTVLVTFTLSAATAGAGAAALALAADSSDGRGRQRGYYFGSVALLVVSLLVRNSSGLAALCFAGGALLIRVLEHALKKDKPAMKRALAFLIAAVAVSGALIGVNAYGRAAQNPEGFVAYDEARSSYMDYPHDTYADNPAAYKEAGWDATLAAMTSNWFYMDERVTTDAFRTIADNSAFSRMSVPDKLSHGVSRIGNLLKSYPLAVYYGLLVCAAYAAAVVMFALNRRRWLPFAGASAFLLGSAGLLAFLAYAGRVNLRVWMTLAIFSSVSIWLCALSSYQTAESEKKPALKNAVRFAFTAILILASLGVGYKVFRTVISYENETPEMLPRSRAVTAYALAHPENVYIRDVYAANNVDALSVYPDDPPTNLMDWGGCDMNTITREQQLALNGLNSTWAKDIFRMDNVYYIGDQDGAYLPLMEEYMTSYCGATGYEIADTVIGGIVSVRFLFGGAQ